LSQPFASPKNALGVCDRCGFQYKLTQLRSEVVDLHVTGFLVCPECWDPDQPQLQVGRWPINDPQAVRNPRPPQGLTQSRYGDAIRYDFTSSADDFTLTGDIGSGETTYGTVTHQSASQTLLSEPYDTATGRLLNGIISPTVSVDASEYEFVRCRVKINSDPVPGPNSAYVGQMYWRTVAGAYPYSAVSTGNYDWFSMGDPYQLLTWELRNDADWAGTIIGLYWVFFSGLTTSGEYEIDYVRFEKE